MEIHKFKVHTIFLVIFIKRLNLNFDQLSNSNNQFNRINVIKQENTN